MSTALADSPPREAYSLCEAISLTEADVQDDGTIIFDLIRPCIGRGQGSHLYEADMLARDAGVFAGWKMYVDHLSEQARKALGGLPRSIRDLGGRIIESWWDPEVPEDPERGFGRGAVRGRVKPVPYVKELIEHDRELVEASINADATGVRPVRRDGKLVWLVEGIKPKGTVDFVTEGGAGGRVASLLEAHMSPEDQEAALFESMSDDEVREYLKEHRPGLIEALNNGAGDEGRSPEGDGHGGDEVKITPEALREALSTDEGRQELAALVREIATDDEIVNEIVEARMAEERSVFRAEAEADANRKIEVRDLRDHAVSLIEAARLPERLAEQSKAKFALTESGPTPDLDVLPEVDDDGNVTKSAMQVLTEAVQAEIDAQRDLAASFRPTRVTGQGPSGDGSGEGDGEKPKLGQTPRVAALLQESGFNDPDKVWATA